MQEYTIADMQFLNSFKNRVRETTKLLDETGIKKYPPTLETHEVKHAVVILLDELQFHGLLPETVTIAQASEHCEKERRADHGEAQRGDRQL